MAALPESRACRPLLALLAVGLLAAAPAARAQPSLTPWTALRFEARKLFLKGWVEMKLLPPGAEPAPIRECEEGPGLAPGPEGVTILEIESKVGDRKRSTLWLDAGTGAVLQVQESKEGESWKLRRYGTTSAHSWRARPHGRHEEDLAPEAWSRRKDGHVAWDQALTSGLRSTDGYDMVVLACSEALAATGAKLSAFTVSHDDLVRVDFQNAGPGEDDANVDVEGGAPLRGTVKTRRILVNATILSDDDDDDAPAPFGLRGPVTVEVDEATGLPVEVRGRVPKLGEIRIQLTRATMR